MTVGSGASGSEIGALTHLKWRRVTSTTGGAGPKARHGHRAVSVRELVIVFGGGNEGICDDMHVFNTRMLLLSDLTTLPDAVL